MSIAALPYREGYDVKIIDQRVNPNWRQELIKSLSGKPVAVGITSLTGPSLKNALNAAQIVKATSKETPVIFGGVHATLLPEMTMNEEYIDYVVKGEGDYVLYNLLECIRLKTPITEVRGVYYKDKGGISFTGESERIMDMDALPDSPYSLIDLSKYKAADIEGKSISFQSARGCPFKCKFCANAKLQKSVWRHMSVKKLMAKIEFLQREHGYKTFMFLDDCTSANVNHTRELIDGFLHLEKHMVWTTNGIRADLISQLDDKDIKGLWDGGCRALDIGVESGNDEMLVAINKSETKDIIRAANKKLSRQPIIIKYTFLIGFPGETMEQVNDTIDFYLTLSKENPNAYPMVFIYTPIPGTDLYFEALENGFKQPSTSMDWVYLDFKTWLYKYPNWVKKSDRMKLETIMIASLFCNKNARFKLTTPFSKIAFFFYHPFAKLRFRYKFFRIPIEALLSRMLSG